VSAEALPLEGLGFAACFVELARGAGRAPAILGGPAALEEDPGDSIAPMAEAVAGALIRLAQELDAPPASLENAKRLSHGALAVVTGQQPGLLGGPLLILHKAATAVRLAQSLQSRFARPVVPVLWVESDDHDLDEVNRLSLVNAEGELEHLSVEGLDAGPPVGRIRFGERGRPLLDALASLLPGAEEARELAKRCLAPGDSFASSFARCLLLWLGPRGLVICDPSLPELKQAAAPLVRAALERPDEAEAALRRGEILVREAGYQLQAPLGEGALPVFRQDDGRRRRVEHAARASALEALDRDPAQLSPGVHLRPVVQDTLLPTVAAVLGPAEATYHAQLGPLYEWLGRRRPPAVPRASLTLVEPRVRRILERYGFDLEMLRGPRAAAERRAASQRAPVDLEQAAAAARRRLETAFDELAGELERLDRSLKDSATGHRSRALTALDGLIRKAEAAARRADTVARRHVAVAANRLAPEGKLQERILGSFALVAEYGDIVADRVLEHAEPCTGSHLLVDL
jgi:bacillithiol biosynthesis cysteine-adding enzyme BshC